MKSLPASAVEEDRTGSPWRVLCASVTGRSHRLNGKGNDDAVTSVTLPGGGVVLALADGAGSARRGGEGASIAVHAAAQSLLTQLKDEGECSEEMLVAALETSLLDVRRALASRARASRARPRQFACTLILVLLGERLTATLQLGDGAALARSEGGWERLTAPHRGRYAGETVFVTSRGAVRQAVTEVCPTNEVRAIALLSDGLEPVATDVATDRPHEPFFEPLVSFASSAREVAELEAELCRFLESERVQARCSDDLSLILAVKPT